MSEPVNEFDDTERAQEALVHRALRELPLRRAPARLEYRVLQELGRRSALPWWRGSFMRWPRTVQAAFGFTCAALTVLTVIASGRVGAHLGALQPAAALPMSWLQRLTTLAAVAEELTASLGRLLPVGWVYAGLVASVALYAALSGLAVAAYRTLYLKSEPAGDLRP
jgi:hypothetical protein